MSRFDADIKERARVLRDQILESVEDKSNPRYIELMSRIESRAKSRAAEESSSSPVTRPHP